MRWRRCLPVAAGVLLWSLIGSAAGAEALPYDRTCPVVYDNDGAIESGFTDAYVMALASAKEIRLKGIITTCSYGEEQRKPAFSPLPEAELVRERQELIEKARRSGLRHLPDATAGPSLSLKRPASGRIEDTLPDRAPGALLILREARQATAAKPLVVLMGGQATCVVSAYLLDPSIAAKMVLAWIVGNKRPDGAIDSNEYNAGVDPWATSIAFERLRVVAFPFTNDGNDGNDAIAATPKSRLGELPDTELRRTMSEARWPRGKGTFSEPAADYDAVGAFPLTRPDYVRQTRRFSFSRWEPSRWDAKLQVPFFQEDPKGKVLVVWDASAAAATDEWWRRMKDPAAWGRPEGQAPFRGKPWPVPGTIEAWGFDHGGEGRAYHDNTNNLTQEEWFNPIRFLEQVDLARSKTAGGGYKVVRTEAGEWLAYTVQVARAGTYTLDARVACDGPGGAFHVELDGVDRTGVMAVPATGGPDAWQVVSRPGVLLSAGRHVLRLVIERAGPAGTAGNFDSLRFARTSSRASAAAPYGRTPHGPRG